MKKFLVELYNRLFKLETPDFFKIISRISALCGTIAGLPFILVQFESQLNTKLPDFVHALSNKVVFYGAVISFIISKLTAKDASSEINKIDTKLPYTKAKD